MSAYRKPLRNAMAGDAASVTTLSPVARFSVGSWRFNKPVPCRTSEEALALADALQVNRIQVLLPNHTLVMIWKSGGGWLTEGGMPIWQIQRDIDKLLLSSIAMRAANARSSSAGATFPPSAQHAGRDAAELKQIQNTGRLLDAWSEMRKMMLASQDYRVSLATALRFASPALHPERYLAHVLHARATVVRAWAPAFAQTQAERQADEYEREASGYERELQWQHMRHCAKCNPFFRMRLSALLPDWRRFPSLITARSAVATTTVPGAFRTPRPRA